MGDYIIPAGYGEAEYIDKKSRFIGQVEHGESEAEGRAWLSSERCVPFRRQRRNFVG